MWRGGDWRSGSTTTSGYIFPEDISHAPPGESASAYGTGKRWGSKIYIAGASSDVRSCATAGLAAAVARFVNLLPHTGGKGSLTLQVRCESIVSSETICPHFTQQVHAGYFLKVPTNSPSKNPPGKV